MASIHWLLVGPAGPSQQQQGLPGESPVKLDVFKSPQRKGASPSSTSTKLSLALPNGLIQRLAQLCLEQGEDSLICLSRACHDSRSPLVLLDRRSVKQTDRRLCAGACVAPRPNLHAVLSPALLERLQCSEQRTTVRGGVEAFRTLYHSIKIGVWNLGAAGSGKSVPKGVPLKIEWQMRGLETFGAPPGVGQASECLVGASSAIVQLLEAGHHGIMLLSAGGGKPIVAVNVSEAVRPTDKRLLLNSCAATDAERHCWLSAALRLALRLEKKEERKNVPAFKTLYSPVSVGFLVPESSDLNDCGDDSFPTLGRICSGMSIRRGSSSSGSSSGSNSSKETLEVLTEVFEFRNGGICGISSVNSSPSRPKKRESINTISPEAISEILAGNADSSKSRNFRSSALAHELCAAAKAVLSLLEAAPRRLAVTRYMLRAEAVESAGLWDEALLQGADRFVEPHQALPSPDELVPDDEELVIRLCLSPSLDPPPPSPFSVSPSIFSPAAPARSAAEARRKQNSTRPYYGCVFGTPAPGAPPCKVVARNKGEEQLDKEERKEESPWSPPAIRSSILSASRTPGDAGRRRGLTTPPSARGSPASAAKSSPRGCFASSPDQFTATKVSRAEQSLPRFYVDACGLVRELIACALERRGKQRDAKAASASKAAAGAGAAGPSSPVALHASILAHHAPRHHGCRGIDPLTLATAAQCFAFFSSLPSPSEAKTLLSAAPTLPAYTWVRVLEPRLLRPGDCVAVQDHPSADGAGASDASLSGGGHVWAVLDIHLDPRTQLVVACTIIESVPSTRDPRDNRGGVHSRVVDNAAWEKRFDWAIARMLD